MPILHLSQLIGVAAGLRGVEAEVPATRRAGDSRHRAARSLSLLWIAVVLGAAVALALAWGWYEAGWVRLRTLEVEVPSLPAELDGMRIVHLSDFHLGLPSRGARAVERAVAWTREREPGSRVPHGRSRLAGRGVRRSSARSCASCRAATPSSATTTLRSVAIPSRRRSSCAAWSRRLCCSTRAGWSTCGDRGCGSPGSIRGRADASPCCIRTRSLTILLSHFPIGARPPGRRGVRPPPRGAHARRPDLPAVPGWQATAGASVGSVHARLLPPRRDADARLARAGDDVRAVPLLRAPGGDGARPAARFCPSCTCLGDSPRDSHSDSHSDCPS